MSDYYRLDFNIMPQNNDAADLLAAFLADIGFETFEPTETGLSAYIQKALFKHQQLEQVVEEFPFDVKIGWKKEFIPHQDWNEEWEKKYFKPLVLAGGRCVIHSSFHKDYPESEIEVIVDPKMAFGTGHHATTSMMVSYLFDLELEGKTVLDMGTGTGILAIIAKKLGAEKAFGIEIDHSAYENALENIAINHVDVVLLLGDARELEGMSGINVFLANINRNIILADLKNYIRVLAEDAELILSGFYLSDVDLLKEALEENGMVIAEVRSEGESQWASIRAKKNSVIK